MVNSKKIGRVEVEGLQGVFNYHVDFPDGADTVILIAPNGYGKTALLSLLRDCVALNMRKVAAHTFSSVEITFQDRTKWKFERRYDPEPGRFDEVRRVRSQPAWSSGNRAQHRRPSPYWVAFERYDSSGSRVEEQGPDLKKINPRLLSRVLDRMPFLSMESPSLVRDIRTNELIKAHEAFSTYYHEIAGDPFARDLLISVDPSVVWSDISGLNCVFIETQRLLYSRPPSLNEDDVAAPQEEILRQAQNLSGLLQKNYSDYAARSQALDRSFPNRLIARARDGVATDTDALRAALFQVEQKREALTEAGILLEQADTIIATDDELLPKVVDALQVYVEDSQEKLSTYDEIFPKVSVFRELMSRKLKPKKLSIGRDFGASVSRDGEPLTLDGLSSGEKHEFIMLFKLVFETPSDALVLIDEPEISLHVVWQLEFMSDLRQIQSANPFQSIIATHSPQIFQGFKHLLIDLADQVQ